MAQQAQKPRSQQGSRYLNPGGRNNQPPQGQRGLPRLPEWVRKKADQQREKADLLYQQAQKKIPENYHDFLIRLSQDEKITTEVFDCCDVGYVYSIQGKGTYVSVELPYFTVDGRVKWAVEDHEKKEKKFHIGEPEVLQEFNIMKVPVESEIHGTRYGIIDLYPKRGASKSHPFAKAQTACIGRALGLMGYGLVGTGIASADEMKLSQGETNQEIKEMEEQQEKSQTSKVVPIRQNQSRTQAELLAYRQANSSKPAWEMVFTNGEKTLKVFAGGKMYESVKDLNLQKGSLCQITVTKTESGLYILDELELM